MRHTRGLDYRRSLAAMTLGLALAIAPALASPVVAAAASAYPRVAIWWPDSDHQDVADRSRCDWTALQSHDGDHIAELRAANPDIVVVGTTSARELNYRLDDYNDPLNMELRSASTDWILTQVGSRLTAAITNSQTSIPAADVTKFAAGEMVLVDHELMYVDSVGSSSLTVTRGQVMPTAAHASNARIAAVVSNWPSSVSMDLSTYCRKADVGHGAETWSDWNVRRGRATADSADWDGLLIDCFASNRHWRVVALRNNRSIDPDRSNTPVTDGYAAFDSAWHTGASDYADALRAAVGPSFALVGNGNLRDFGLNGSIFEEFPYRGISLTNWNIIFLGPYEPPHASYPEWCTGAADPNLTMIQTYGARTDYRLMRFGLTSALMGDGYFSFAGSASGHAWSGLWWYDEYDDAGAGRGYLGDPTGPPVPVGGAWRRDYERGIVLVNPSAGTVTAQLGSVFRKIKGPQAPSVNDGSDVRAVSIPSQDGIILKRVTPTSIGIRTSRHFPKPYQWFTLSGWLAPGRLGDRVVVHIKRSGGSRWSVARLAYDADGDWSYRLRLRTRGTYYFWVEYRGDADRATSRSRTIHVHVR